MFVTEHRRLVNKLNIILDTAPGIPLCLQVPAPEYSSNPVACLLLLRAKITSYNNYWRTFISTSFHIANSLIKMLRDKLWFQNDSWNHVIRKTATPFLLFFWHLFLVISFLVSASFAFLSLHSSSHRSEVPGPVGIHRWSTECLSYPLMSPNLFLYIIFFHSSVDPSLHQYRVWFWVPYHYTCSFWCFHLWLKVNEAEMLE